MQTMRNLLISLLLPLTLTACADGSNGANGANGSGTGSASNTHIVNPLGTIGTGNNTPEYADIDADTVPHSLRLKPKQTLITPRLM